MIREVDLVLIRALSLYLQWLGCPWGTLFGCWTVGSCQRLVGLTQSSTSRLWVWEIFRCARLLGAVKHVGAEIQVILKLSERAWMLESWV